MPSRIFGCDGEVSAASIIFKMLLVGVWTEEIIHHFKVQAAIKAVDKVEHLDTCRHLEERNRSLEAAQHCCRWCRRKMRRGARQVSACLVLALLCAVLFSVYYLTGFTRLDTAIACVFVVVLPFAADMMFRSDYDKDA